MNSDCPNNECLYIDKEMGKDQIIELLNFTFNRISHLTFQLERYSK